MKKQLDTTGIANELKDASVFFAADSSEPKKPSRIRPPKTATPQTSTAAVGFSEKEKHAPVQPVERSIEPTKKATVERSPERTMDRTLERLLPRTKVRHTFDVFADQVTSLKRILLEREEMFQKRYLLGDLVQEALDMFITKQRNNDEPL